VVRTHHATIEEFERFITLPENDDRLFEYIGGEIVEVVTNNYCSLVAANILIALGAYVKSKKLGYVTGEAGGYVVGDQRYIPDVGFVSKKKQAEPSHDTFNPNPPDLAVEVLSPTDKPRKVRTKIVNYLNAGTTVWLVDPAEKEIEVYSPGKSVKTLGIDDTLDGSDVVPGFKMPVKDIFET